MALSIGTNVMKLNVRGQSGKSTMPLDKACREMGPERASRTRALDRTASHLNTYHFPEGVTSGQGLADWFCLKVAEANERIRKRNEAGERTAKGARLAENRTSGSHAVNPAITMTVTPDEEGMRRLALEDQVRVLMAVKDAYAAWAGHEPDAWAIHLDEGTRPGTVAQMHIVDRPVFTDEDPDRYAGKRFSDGGRLRAWHRSFDKEVSRRLPPELLERVGGIKHHMTADERQARRDDGEYVPEPGMPANLHAAARQAEAYVARAREVREHEVRAANEASKRLVETNAQVLDAERKRQDALSKRDRAAIERDEAEAARVEAVAERDRAAAEAEDRRAEATTLVEGIRMLGEEGGGIDLPDGTHLRSMREYRSMADAEDRRVKDARARADRAERAATEAEVAAQAARGARQAAEAAHRAQREAWAEERQAHERELAAFEDAKEERRETLADLDRQVRQRRDDLTVSTRRGPMRLAEVLTCAFDVVADALDAAGGHKAAAWVRKGAGWLRERAIDRLTPETRTRELADSPDVGSETGHGDYQIGA